METPCGMASEGSELVTMYLYLVWLLQHHLGFFSDEDELALRGYRDVVQGWLLLAIWLDIAGEECKVACRMSTTAAVVHHAGMPVVRHPGVADD